MVGLAVVIGPRMEHQSPAEDVVAAVQLDQAVYEVNVGCVGLVKLNVAEISNVAYLVIGVAVVVLEYGNVGNVSACF